MSGRSERALLCPSARCETGATLLGIVGQQGTIAFIPIKLVVDKAFVSAATAYARPPEQRFRFANRCMKGGCRHWHGARCHVADMVIEHVKGGGEPLPACSIRESCRWFAQRGALACSVCADVITDMSAAFADTEGAADKGSVR